MGINEIQRNIVFGDGNMESGAQHVADAMIEYEAGSQAAQALSEVMVGVSEAFGRLKEAYSNGHLSLNLGDISIASALRSYGTEGADLDNSDHAQAQQTIGLTRSYREQLKDIRTRSNGCIDEFDTAAVTVERLRQELQNFANSFFSIFGVIAEADAPALENTAKKQQKASAELKHKIG